MIEEPLQHEELYSGVTALGRLRIGYGMFFKDNPTTEDFISSVTIVSGGTLQKELDPETITYSVINLLACLWLNRLSGNEDINVSWAM